MKLKVKRTLGYMGCGAWIDAWPCVEVWAGATATIERKGKHKKEKKRTKARGLILITHVVARMTPLTGSGQRRRKKNCKTAAKVRKNSHEVEEIGLWVQSQLLGVNVKEDRASPEGSASRAERERERAEHKGEENSDPQTCTCAQQTKRDRRKKPH